MLILLSCSSVENSEQGADDTVIDFNETTENILNPDRGFYSPNLLVCNLEGIKGFDEGLAYKNNLVHTLFDISAFSGLFNGNADIDFNEKMLSELKNIFEVYRKNGTCAVVRFAYDPKFGGNADKEPSLEQMKKHIKQLEVIFKEYTDVISAIEVGMVGPWGEMHTSKIAVQETWNELINAFLDATSEKTCILVRQPNFYYNWQGISIDNLLTQAPSHEKAYRVGVYNDGYLGSDDDLGTYRNRKIETEWLNKQAQTTLFGGEVTIPGSEFNKINYAAKEMFITHTAYLNLFWNNKVVDEWKATLYNDECGDEKSSRISLCPS
ncbi:MAG: Dockerin type 1 [Clostridia bacterium]|nr:Dockerin type 1 [Clostridia bacterium]